MRVHVCAWCACFSSALLTLDGEDYVNLDNVDLVDNPEEFDQVILPALCNIFQMYIFVANIHKCPAFMHV